MWRLLKGVRVIGCRRGPAGWPGAHRSRDEETSRPYRLTNPAGWRAVQHPAGAVVRHRAMLAAHATPAPVIEEEVRHMRDYRLAPTANRSVVGIMIEFSRLAEAHRDGDPRPDLTELAHRVARTPCSPLYGSNVSPDRELAAFLHTVTSTPGPRPTHTERR